jgi:ATP-dependent RNA helicase RhlE
MSFTSLGLSTPLLRAVAEENYAVPTPVQLAAIPAVLGGGDLRVSAQTGSGKTAAFVLPILEQLAKKRRGAGRFCRALILVPTRELAAQVGESVRRYGRFLPEPIKTLVVYGGVSINPQMLALGGGVDVLVATPGRLLDLIGHNAVSLSELSLLVFDEADRLLALGFAEELGRIVALLPAQRQSLFFSATFPPAVAALADGLLQAPRVVEVAPPLLQPSPIVERAIEVDAPRRTQLLRHLVQENGWSRVLVFVATKYATEHVAEKLRRAGLEAGALHGELSQGARTEALAHFKAGRIRVLVATDLAARGLDIDELAAVVNFDLPRSAVDYVHRIGRTGRAGAGGVAVSFISAENHAHFELIERRHARRTEREHIVGFEPQELAPPPPLTDGTGGVKGKRKSKKDKLREAAGQLVARPQEPMQKQSAPFVADEPKEFFPWAQRPMSGRRAR